jgi:hypothetical protein
MLNFNLITNNKQTKQKHNTICIGHHYAQTNTNNVNKTWALLTSHALSNHFQMLEAKKSETIIPSVMSNVYWLSEKYIVA